MTTTKTTKTVKTLKLTESDMTILNNALIEKMENMLIKNGYRKWTSFAVLAGTPVYELYEKFKS